jgi:anti-sigma B factor antagonist
MDAEAEFRQLEVEEIDGITVARVRDRALDQMMPIMSVSQELTRLVESRNIRKLLLDLERVNLMSSIMLGKLISLQSRISSKSGQLVLCNLQPRVYEVCAITKLTRLFDIQPDEAKALATFQNDGRAPA